MSGPGGIPISVGPHSPESQEGQVRAFRDFLHQYNRLSEACFADCIWDFTSRSVTKGESTCAVNCAEKFLRMNQRISTRFQVSISIINFSLGSSANTALLNIFDLL